MRQTQTEFRFRSHGGARRGAGRKRRAERPQVPHRSRPELARRFPVHVTLRVCRDLPSLRRGPFLDCLRRRFPTEGPMRVVHVSLQSNHVHLLVEAEDARALSRGIQGLASGLARAWNRVAGRRGRVFADRYHAHILRTPREVRNGLAYVLLNARRHGVRAVRDCLDSYSSAPGFAGWRGIDCETGTRAAGGTCWAGRARTWLLSRGWLRAGGRIDPGLAPG